MSTRISLYSLDSIEPIRGAVSSGNKTLAKVLAASHKGNLLKEYQEDGEEPDDDDLEDIQESVEEYQETLDQMILCPKSPDAEPGCWNYVITDLADHLKLNVTRLPLDDWKHYGAWQEYRSVVAKQIPPENDNLLALLENGRPLAGSKIEHDGCVFAWLTKEETEKLSASLRDVDKAPLESNDLDEFHDELVECLDKTVASNSDLFLASH